MKRQWLEGLEWIAPADSLAAVRIAEELGADRIRFDGDLPLIMEALGKFADVRWILELKEQDALEEILQVTKATHVTFAGRDAALLRRLRLEGYPSLMGVAYSQEELCELLKENLPMYMVEKSLLHPLLVEQLAVGGSTIYPFDVVRGEELYRLIHWGVGGVVTSRLHLLRQEAVMAFQELDPHELIRMIDNSEVTLIDVRGLKEFEDERLANALLMPFNAFSPQHIVAPKEKKLVFYCQVGTRSNYAAKEYLAQVGDRSCYHLKGGLNAWKELGLPTIR